MTDALPMVYADLRFSGDALDPREIAAALPPVAPRRMHKKGEKFNSGPRAGDLIGKTGIWYLTTDKFVDSSAPLADHVAYLKNLLIPSPGNNIRLMRLRDVMGRSEAEASLSVFWHGRRGDQPPTIPDELIQLAGELGAKIETDFRTEGEEAA